MCGFEQFVKTGKLGEIYLAQKYEDVLTILGEPEGIGGNKSVKILKYDAVQITIQGGIVILIGVYLCKGVLPKIPKPCSKDEWTITGSTTIEETLDILDSTRIQWQVDKKLTFDSQLCIVTEGGVGFYFALDYRKLDQLSISRYKD